MIQRLRTWLGWKLLGKEQRLLLDSLLMFQGKILRKLGPAIVYEICVKDSTFVIVEQTAEEAGEVLH